VPDQAGHAPPESSAQRWVRAVASATSARDEACARHRLVEGDGDVRPERLLDGDRMFRREAMGRAIEMVCGT
jgi:hypothetical protein